jgi:hypothetical protein
MANLRCCGCARAGSKNLAVQSLNIPLIRIDDFLKMLSVSFFLVRSHRVQNGKRQEKYPHLCSRIEHTLLNAILGDEAEEIYLPRLSDPMSAIHCLQVS